jgi:glycerol-3-phosphate acyltransferase PlsY
VVGHLFPIWLKFKGGKGVATALGVITTLAWPVGIACCLTWLAVAAIFRYSSLASLLSLAAAPLFSWLLLGDLQMVELTAALALLIWLRHQENIRRLVRGEESKIGQKKPE